jgi:glutamate synthase (NADPH/NADH) small chain
VNHAIEEGVNFRFNVQPLEIISKGVRVVETTLGPADDSGRRRPRSVPGSEKTVKADAVIVAFGFNASPEPWFSKFDITTDKWGLVEASESSSFAYQTSNPKVFAAGDMVRGADLVVTAIADARKAALGMVDFVQGKVPIGLISPSGSKRKQET